MGNLIGCLKEGEVLYVVEMNSTFEEYHGMHHQEHIEKERRIIRDLELHYFFRNVLCCFTHQFPDQLDFIKKLLFGIPLENVQPWATLLVSSIIKSTGSSLEESYQAVTKRFVENANKKDVPRYYGFYTHKDIIRMEIRVPRYYDHQTKLMEASAPLDYTFIEGLALMVRGQYYDTPGARTYTTDFTGK